MKILCWIGIHKWEVTHHSWRTIALAHISRLCGCRAKCARCQKVFDDLPYGRMVHPITKAVVNSSEEL